MLSADMWIVTTKSGELPFDAIREYLASFKQVAHVPTRSKDHYFIEESERGVKSLCKMALEDFSRIPDVGILLILVPDEAYMKIYTSAGGRKAMEWFVDFLYWLDALCPLHIEEQGYGVPKLLLEKGFDAFYWESPPWP